MLMTKQTIVLPTHYDGTANLTELISFRVTPEVKRALSRSARRRGFPTLSSFFQQVAIMQVERDMQEGATITETETEAA